MTMKQNPMKKVDLGLMYLLNIIKGEANDD